MAWSDTKKARRKRNVRKIKSKFKFITIILIISFVFYGATWVVNNSEDISTQLLELKPNNDIIPPMGFEEDDEEEYEEKDHKLPKQPHKFELDFKLKL